MATAKVLLEIGVIGQKNVEKEITSLSREIKKLEVAEKNAAKGSKKAIREVIKELKAERAARLRNQKAIISNTTATAAFIKNNKLSAFQLQNLTKSHGANTRILQKNNLGAKDFNKTQGNLRRTTSTLRSEMKRKNLLDAQSVANTLRMVQITRKLEATNKKNNVTLKDATGKTKKHRNALRDLSSSAVLSFGPLSGIGSRIIAMSAIMSRGTIVIGIIVLALVALTTILAKAIGRASELERSMGRLTAVIRATGRASKITAEEIEGIVNKIDKLTLGNAGELRQAAGILLSEPSLPAKRIEELLLLTQNLNTVLKQSSEQSARLIARIFQDPLQASESLRRANVILNDSEKALIATLSNFGRKAEAVNVIINRLSKNVSGSATGEARGLAGAVDLLSRNWRILLEDLGKTGVLQTATSFINSLAAGLAKVGRLIRLIFPLDIGTLNIKQLTNEFTNIQKKIDTQKLLLASAVPSDKFTIGKQLDFLIRKAQTVASALAKARAAKNALGDKALVDAGRVGKKPEPPSIAELFSGPLTGKGLTQFNKVMRDASIESIKLSQEMRVLNGETRNVEAGTISLASSILNLNKPLTEEELLLFKLNKQLVQVNERFRKLRLEADALKVIADTKTPLEKFNNEMQRLKELVNSTAISWEVYRRASEKALSTLISADPLLNTLRSGVDKLGDSMLDAFRSGESVGRAFKNMLGEISQELAKMIFKLGVIEPLIRAAFGQQASSGGSGIFGTILSSIAGAFTGGSSLASVGGFGAGGGGLSASIFGAHGFDGIVKGSGGTDSQSFNVNATPGERLTIQTPAQQKSKSGTTNIFGPIDMRGASVDAVIRLEKLVQKVNGSIEKRAVAAVTNARGRNPELFGARTS